MVVSAGPTLLCNSTAASTTKLVQRFYIPNNRWAIANTGGLNRSGQEGQGVENGAAGLASILPSHENVLGEHMLGIGRRDKDRPPRTKCETSDINGAECVRVLRSRHDQVCCPR